MAQAKTLSSDYPDNKIADWFEKLFMNLYDEKQQFSVSCFEEKNEKCLISISLQLYFKMMAK